MRLNSSLSTDIYILVPKTVPPRDIAVHRITLKTDAVFPPTSTSRGAARGGSDYLTVAGCPTGVHSCGALSVLYCIVMLCKHRILIQIFYMYNFAVIILM